MEYAQLGKSELKVSRICLGTWQASGWATSDDERVKSSIAKALDSGINFIDTAPAYGNGHSERLVGEVIEGRRDKVVIATKISVDQCEPEKLRACFEQSLKNLRTDYIDLLQQHWPPKSPPLEETLAELVKLKEAGKIRAIGVSNWAADEFEEVQDLSPIDSLQPCYSLLWRRIEEKVLPICKKNDIGVIPYSPLCQGILAGKFKDREELPKDWRRQNVLTKEEIFPEVLTFLDVLGMVAERNKKTMSQTALRWLLDQEGVTSVIVGCSRPSHVEGALGACGWSLSKEDRDLLTRQSEKFISLTSEYKSLWGWHPRR